MKITSFVIILFLSVACSKKNDTSPVQSSTGIAISAPEIHPGDSVTYLALGDSYTFGAGLEQTGSYPFQLAARLRTEDFKAADPLVVASSGWTSSDLLSQLSADHIIKKFDFVTLLIGVNDEHSGIDTRIYTSQFDQLLADAISYANGYSNRVFVISIPDWSVTPFAADMDKNAIKITNGIFNSINESESKRLGANYLDITPLSEQVAVDSTLTGPDGLHPTAKMYALWVNQIYGSITGTFN